MPAGGGGQLNRNYGTYFSLLFHHIVYVLWRTIASRLLQSMKTNLSPLLIDHCRGSERADVTKHMLIHEAPKLSCELCAKTFRHQKNKDLHMKRYLILT